MRWDDSESAGRGGARRGVIPACASSASPAPRSGRDRAPRRHRGRAHAVWRAVLLGAVVGLAAAPVARAEPPARADLPQAREALVARAGDYRASLARLLDLQEAVARRAADLARRRGDQVVAGLVSGQEAEEGRRRHDEARARVEDTRRRLAEVDMVIAETLAAIELAALPPPSTQGLPTAKAVIRHDGAAESVVAELPRLQAFFAARFGRSLPLSALGQTPIHDRLGFDHRHAVDVAVHPDSEEGRALMAFLGERHVPFLAFRGLVRGASTGAHLHVGSPSDRLLPAAWAPPPR